MSKFLEIMLSAYASVTAPKADDEKGATAVEYGLMVALIAVFIIGAVTALGGALDDIFQFVADTIAALVPA